MYSVDQRNVSTITAEKEWNDSNEKEALMHTIHTYPAKFPAFIAQKAFEYAQNEGVDVKSVADVFCGCGTVALEAKLHNVDFWGCDINPVATLIARTKSKYYDHSLLEKYYKEIEACYKNCKFTSDVYEKAPERLKYWYVEKNYIDLYSLKGSISQVIRDNSAYYDAFICIFSSILKASSKWLTKSIKPQVDPQKKVLNVWSLFSSQYRKFYNAVEQINSQGLEKTVTIIEDGNFLQIKQLPTVDMIISSPPYVTSYEYADLHQLSTLWLGYAKDYRELRKGSIGSVYNSESFIFDMKELNSVGREIISNLQISNKNKLNAKIRAVARYYCDIQHALHRCAQMINNGGMAFFVVGDTEYKGVQIKNSEHLISALQTEGFTNIKATKRIISNKLCIPYRDNSGRFSSDKTKRTIYHEEYIISARRWA